MFDFNGFYGRRCGAVFWGVGHAVRRKVTLEIGLFGRLSYRTERFTLKAGLVD